MASKARELANLGNAYSDGALSNRNLIINGAMQVAQRGASHTLTSNNYGSLDRWNGSGYSGPTCTMEQSAVAPANFKNSLKFTVTTGASVDATDYSDVRQYIEGNNVSHLKWGTSDAQDVTVSFWVRCSVTGTFAVSICNSGYTRNYPATYVINSADTWEYKSVTISGDTSGTWLNDGGVGLRLVFDLGIGSTYSSTTGQWSSGTYFGGSGVTKLAATTGATWYVTGVQLEVGDTATPFEHRSYGQELALCERFFKTNREVSGGSNSGGDRAAFRLDFSEMRAIPTFTLRYSSGVIEAMYFINVSISSIYGTWSTRTKDVGIEVNVTPLLPNRVGAHMFADTINMDAEL